MLTFEEYLSTKEHFADLSDDGEQPVPGWTYGNQSYWVEDWVAGVKEQFRYTVLNPVTREYHHFETIEKAEAFSYEMYKLTQRS